MRDNDSDVVDSQKGAAGNNTIPVIEQVIIAFPLYPGMYNMNSSANSFHLS